MCREHGLLTEKRWLSLLGEKGWLDRDSLVHGPETHSKEDKWKVKLL